MAQRKPAPTSKRTPARGSGNAGKSGNPASRRPAATTGEPAAEPVVDAAEVVEAADTVSPVEGVDEVSAVDEVAPGDGISADDAPAADEAPAAKAAPSKAGAAKTPAAKAAKAGAAKAGARPRPGKTTGKPTGRSGAPRPGSGPGKRPPNKKNKSIVQQKQRPWGWIIATIVVIVLAGGLIGYAVTRHSSGVNAADPYRQPEIADAKAIPGVVYKVEPDHTHIASGTVKYDTTPPTGGNHSPYWADCTGTVYPQAIANENAVHMLEHGAVWITYQPGLDKADVATLAKLVTGQDRTAMSPYPGLKTKVSLQAWGYQLFVNSPTDPRIKQFIDALRFNQKTTPEPSATCAQPDFKQHPSTFGHPLFAPATA
jgi:hypothetical protein